MLSRLWSARWRTDVLVVLGVMVVVVAAFGVAPDEAPMLLVVLPPAVLVAALALRFPLFAILLLVATSFVREPLNNMGLGDPVMAAFYGTVLSIGVGLLARTVRAPRLGALEAVMAAYAFWNVFSGLLPHEFEAVDAWRFIVTGTLLPILLYLAGRTLFDREDAVRALLWMTVAFTLYSGLTAVIQFYGPQALVWPRFIVDDPGWEDRAVGIFKQPVTNGLLLVIGFVVALYLAAQPTVRTVVRLGLWATAGLAAAGVYLTYTRSAWLSLAIVVLAGAVLARGWRRPFVVSLVLGAAAVVANLGTLLSEDRSAGGVGSSNEVYDRLNIAATSFQAILDHPIFGVGIGRFTAYNTDHHIAWSQEIDWNRGWAIASHENELGITAELGIPGGLLWIALLVGIAWKLVSARRHLPADGLLGRGFATLALLVLITWQATAVTVDMRFLDFASTLPFLIFGVAVGALDRHQDGAPPAPAGRAPAPPVPAGPPAGPQAEPPADRPVVASR
ncbi:O-antigen ligase [Actinomycetospora cinnamomea]|uniref:O-antigen ligase n=2 Tax=Actinomycetospora cinnamomea TaxID=663609 RepID=A0A2U1F719_9PSEU|nr:O-antigen ligase [Actinomycetospora cinnamomea]